MALEIVKNKAVVTEELRVEDAEVLLEWLIKSPRGRLDLAACTHLHCANLQVLLAARPRIMAWPTEERLATWLRAALTPEAQ